MTSFPTGDEILDAYHDYVEALRRLQGAALTVLADPGSRFHGWTWTHFGDRVIEDLEEIDRWALLMLVASFEAVVRHDAEDRIRWRTKDIVRKPLRKLQEECAGRVRLDDILGIWEVSSGMSPSVKQGVGLLLKHRNWLAHGRHWANNLGIVPSPPEANVSLQEYCQALRSASSDFPRM